MNQETLQISYEAIQNPVLRLLIMFLAGAVTTLAGVIVYLYRERQALQREMIDLNRETIRVYGNVDDAIEAMRREINELRGDLKP